MTKLHVVAWIAVATGACLVGCSKDDATVPSATMPSDAAKPSDVAKPIVYRTRTEAMAQKQFLEALLSECGHTPDRLLQVLGDVPVAEGFHKVSGEEYYVLSYPLRGPQTATVSLDRKPFNDDICSLSVNVDFMDGLQFQESATMLSDLLATTRVGRQAVRARRDAEAQAKEQAKREAQERQDAEARAAQLAEQRRYAEESRRQELATAEQDHTNARRRASEKLSNIHGGLSDAKREAQEMRAWAAERRAELDATEREWAASDAKCPDWLKEKSQKEHRDRLAGLRADVDRRLVPAERKQADFEQQVKEADVSCAAELAQAERYYEEARARIEETYWSRIASCAQGAVEETAARQKLAEARDRLRALRQAMETAEEVVK